MPIYEYRCDQCGHELEKLQKMNEDPLKDCPACEKPELRKLISAAAFRLKGAGWYETDFKQGNKRNIADSGNEAPKDSDTSEAKASKSDAVKSDSAKSGNSDSAKTGTVKKESKTVKQSSSSAS